MGYPIPNFLPLFGAKKGKKKKKTLKGFCKLSQTISLYLVNLTLKAV